MAVVVAALVGGAAWRLMEVRRAAPRLAVVPSRSAVVGTWRVEDGGGGRLELAADGRFSAVGVPVDGSPDGTFTGEGRWALDARRGAVALTPDRVSPDPGPDARLAVVRADGHVELCVTSGSPGVLCDVLLRR